jgi:peptide/nickel transport system substrate-binding protein
MKNKCIFILLLFISSVFLFAQLKQDERVLKVGIESDLGILNPYESGYAVQAKVFWNVFEPLIALEENSTRIRPCLATSWEVSNDNRIWLLKLRQGVKFHDGSSMDADDVIDSASVFQNLEAEVEKVDNYTVRFILPEPNNGFLHKLTNIKFCIASSENVEQFKSLKEKNMLDDYIPVGSGPFKFAQYRRGEEIVLQSFADYWDGEPWLKKLIYKIIPDNKARLTALEKGEIDLIDVIFPSDLIRLQKNPNFRILKLYGMNICYIAINTTHKPLDNVKIRQALNLAVDKMKLTRMFYFGGYGVPTNRILSPAFWGFSALPTPGKYNPAEAKELLAEAGYKDGFSINLLSIPRARPYVPDPIGVSEEIKKQLADIGVKVQIIVPPTYDDFGNMLLEGKHDLALSGWIDTTGHPDYTLNSLLSGKMYVFNLSRWHNKLFDEKLEAARELPINDISGRIKLYNEAQEIFEREAPWIPLFHTKNFVIYNRKVKGIIAYPSSMISYNKVRLQS